MRSAYLDTNILLYLADHTSPFYKSCRKLIRVCRSNTISLTTSTETFQEILHYAQNTKQLDNGLRIAGKFLENFDEILPITLETIREYCKLVRKYPRVRSRDSLHVAVAQEHAMDVIITYDHEFKKFSEIQTATPTEFLHKQTSQVRQGK